ncbi:MAG: Uma2 family endonuclease [Bryobacterales bacterium]|nr:Uma2 family endonuclease [Bryobacterales bacterium]
MGDEGIFEQRIPVAEIQSDPVHYPESDGRFLPENPLQAHAIISVRNDLGLHLKQVANAVVEGNHFIYYRPGDKSGCVAPDVYVLLNHVWKCRSPYRIWVEGKVPDFVLEVISPKSEIRNRVDKKALYSELGVQEYFVFQPNEARPGERLVGYRLWGGEYVELRPDPRSGPERELRSETLGVSLRIAGPLIRVRNLDTGKDYLSHEDLDTVAKEATARAEDARARAKAEKARADTAEARAEANRVRADTAEARSEAAEAELAALKAFLARSGKQLPIDG